MRILITGGKGDLGTRVVGVLGDTGHTVLVGTRAPQPRSDEAVEVRYSLDMTEDDLQRTLQGVDTVVHLATDPRSRNADVTATERLGTAAERAGVGHLVFVSIVGVDRNPYRYYRAKLAAERVVESCSVPWTILRATQFHSLIARFAAVLAKGPAAVVPKGVRLQPIDPNIVAERVAELAVSAASGRVTDLGGPNEIELHTAVRTWVRAAGRRRPVVQMPIGGKTIASARRGDLLATGGQSRGRTFDDYVADHPPAKPDGVGRFLRISGWLMMGIAAWMLLSPSAFVATIAGFGETSDHFVRDIAVFSAPLGTALVLAASRPSWRVPVISLALFHNTLHLINHAIDVSVPEAAWQGAGNLVALGVFEILLVVALRVVRRPVRSKTATPKEAIA